MRAMAMGMVRTVMRIAKMAMRMVTTVMGIAIMAMRTLINGNENAENGNENGK